MAETGQALFDPCFGKDIVITIVEDYDDDDDDDAAAAAICNRC